MGATKPLVKEINQYLSNLNTEQQKAVLTVVKAFAEIQQHDDDLWENEAAIAELDRRTAEYESGKAKVLTLDQLESKVRKAYKAKARAKR